jgi:hypothetical protein
MSSRACRTTDAHSPRYPCRVPLHSDISKNPVTFRGETFTQYLRRCIDLNQMLRWRNRLSSSDGLRQPPAQGAQPSSSGEQTETGEDGVSPPSHHRPVTRQMAGPRPAMTVKRPQKPRRTPYGNLPAGLSTAAAARPACPAPSRDRPGRSAFRVARCMAPARSSCHACAAASA